MQPSTTIKGWLVVALNAPGGVELAIITRASKYGRQYNVILKLPIILTTPLHSASNCLKSTTSRFSFSDSLNISRNLQIFKVFKTYFQKRVEKVIFLILRHIHESPPNSKTECVRIFKFQALNKIKPFLFIFTNFNLSWTFICKK